MRKGQRTKFFLLETATHIIGNEGVDQLTARNLAKKAGLSLGLVNHYFPRFAEIFEEITEYIFESHKPNVRNESLPTPEEKLYFQIEANFVVSVLNYPHQYKALLLAYYYVGVNPRITKYLRDSLKNSIGDSYKYLLQAAERRAKSPVGMREFAQSISEMTEGALVFCSMLKTKKEKIKYAEEHLNRQKALIELYLQSLPDLKP